MSVRFLSNFLSGADNRADQIIYPADQIAHSSSRAHPSALGNAHFLLPRAMTLHTNSSSQEPDLTPQHVTEAYSLIKSALHKTPILTSKSVNSLTPSHGGLSLFFKAEIFQKTGAFKFRGASHAIARLKPSALERGVVTHSSGNHSAALACAASQRGIKCHVVMVLFTCKNKLINYGSLRMRVT